MELFLDCDGVLVDFDRGAARILGMPPRAFVKRHGLPAFWKRLARDGDFYAMLPLMPTRERCSMPCATSIPSSSPAAREVDGPRLKRKIGPRATFPARGLSHVWRSISGGMLKQVTCLWMTRSGIGICGKKPAEP